MPHSDPVHPGLYVRAQVIPDGMSVTEAARIIGVGRPALSNLLNGKAGLSRQMVDRLARAFGADAESLMGLQSTYEAAHQTERRSVAAEVARHVPPFLMATANDIEDWAGKHEARRLLSVLLRTLVNSTCGGLQLVDFPGRDDSERPGWDGRVDTSEGNQWVPAGVSAWEFGTNKNIKSKANNDYTTRTKRTDEKERQETTFVFVTPRRWKGKSDWLRAKNAEGFWRGVRALDASDLEQWLEQSIPAQAWFAGCLRRKLAGVKSLDRCWVEWCADCKPTLSKKLFDQAVSVHEEKVLSHLRNKRGGVLRIVADSTLEGLAFLSALLTEDDQECQEFRDRIVVFSEEGPLADLTVASSDFIPVMTSGAVEREFAQSGCNLTGLVVDHRTAVAHESAVALDPLSSQAFTDGLEAMGGSREEIERWGRESGRSLTVLRRRLATSPATSEPDWSSDEALARSLVPMMLAGAWVSDKADDRDLMTALAGYDDYETLERDIIRLRDLEDSPVWREGGFCGVVSKIDALFGVQRWVTEEPVKRFMEIAELVLSEPDPALDLAEKDRWAAALYGKDREYSSPLRNGIAESLVLLSIHGHRLLGGSFPQNPEIQVSNLVRRLLEPLTAEGLLSQSSNLPLYAEAAPEAFLEIFERDLATEKPDVAALMRPTGDVLFQPSTRVDLLWALELLAWHPKWLSRVVELLAQLAALEPDDNLANKPSASLQSIFRSWLPQTVASIQERKAAFDSLVARHPEVAWRIAVSQFDHETSFGEYSHKPRWRDYALDAGEPVTNGEHQTFAVHCVETCLAWPSHTRETLADLLQCGNRLGPHYLKQLGKAVADWAKRAEDPDRAWLRERLRVSMRRDMRRTARSTETDAGTKASILVARKAYAALEPDDLIWKHAWLFENAWVPESWDDVLDDVDLEAQSNRVREWRGKAVRQVFASAGPGGLLRLAFSGSAPQSVGVSMAEIARDDEELLDFVLAAIEDGDILNSSAHQSLVWGVFQGVGDDRAVDLVQSLWDKNGAEVGTRLLCLCGFGRQVWATVDCMGKEVANEYWTNVHAHRWQNHTPDDVNFAVSRLLRTGRPMAALVYAHVDWGRVESGNIREVLVKLPASDELAHPESRLDAYAIREALKVLDQRKAFSQAEMASLEFLYLNLFWLDDEELPNLESEIEANPELFCELVALVYRREGASTQEEPTEEQRKSAQRAYRLLDKLKRIPGHDTDGNLSAERLAAWVRKAREFCRKNGRQRMGDQQIGGLLANAPEGDDGVWPCLEVRDALEDVLNDDIRTGFEVGRRNLRGGYWRGEGGAQERELAAQYRDWAKACEYSHPKVAATLRRLESAYNHEAHWHDEESAVQRRIGY